MRNMPQMVYQTREDATVESELNALAGVYRLILDCHAKRKTAEPAPELDSRDVVKESNGYDATENYTESS